MQYNIYNFKSFRLFYKKIIFLNLKFLKLTSSNSRYIDIEKIEINTFRIKLIH